MGGMIMRDRSGLAPRAISRQEPLRRAPSRARLRPLAALLAQGRRQMHPVRRPLDRYRNPRIGARRASHALAV